MISLDETDVVITLAGCSLTWALHNKVEAIVPSIEHILHIAVTTPPCDRLSDTCVLVPIVTPDNAMVQLIR